MEVTNELQTGLWCVNQEVTNKSIHTLPERTSQCWTWELIQTQSTDQ